MPSGGYRKPSKPAPVSGPGALSKRTDKGQPVRPVTGLPYGENSDFQDIQSSAPLAQAPAPPPGAREGAGRSAATGPGAGVVPLSAPTQYPDEPVTTGNPRGPGAGPEVLRAQGPQDIGLAATLAKLVPFDRTGDVQRLYQLAKARNW